MPVGLSNRLVYTKRVMEKSKALYLYFDGSCHLCSTEISHYKSVDTNNVLGLIDISSDEFDPVSEGLNEHDFEKYFHVKKKNGEILKGVNAFKAIWDELEIMKPLSFAASTGPGFLVMDSVYKVFAALRPYLPKKKNKMGCPIS